MRKTSCVWANIVWFTNISLVSKVLICVKSRNLISNGNEIQNVWLYVNLICGTCQKTIVKLSWDAMENLNKNIVINDRFIYIFMYGNKNIHDFLVSTFFLSTTAQWSNLRNTYKFILYKSNTLHAQRRLWGFWLSHSISQAKYQTTIIIKWLERLNKRYA